MFIIRRLIYAALYPWSSRRYYSTPASGYVGWVEVPYFGAIAYIKQPNAVELEHGFERWDWIW